MILIIMSGRVVDGVALLPARPFLRRSEARVRSTSRDAIRRCVSATRHRPRPWENALVRAIRGQSPSQSQETLETANKVGCGAPRWHCAQFRSLNRNPEHRGEARRRTLRKEKQLPLLAGILLSIQRSVRDPSGG